MFKLERCFERHLGKYCSLCLFMGVLSTTGCYFAIQWLVLFRGGRLSISFKIWDHLESYLKKCFLSSNKKDSVR